MVSIRIKLTLPKTNFKDKGWVDAVSNALKQKSSPKMKELFRKSTFGWSSKPSFRQELKRATYRLSMEVYTQDALYGLINAGSPKHDIPARSGGWLRFRPGYRSATTAGSLQSRRAYRSGPYWKARIIKPHPGFKARKFDELVAEEYGKEFPNDIQDAINTAARS